MPQYTNSVVEVSESGDFETQINKLYRELLSGSTGKNSVASGSIDPSTIKPQDYSYSNILYDRGNGRITSGLRSLNLLSILCSGTTPQNLFLFDSVVYSGSVHQFKTGTDTALINLVIANLGMETIVINLPESSTTAFKDKCLKMGKDIKVGGFIVETYRQYTLAECKKLTKLYLKGNQ